MGEKLPPREMELYHRTDEVLYYIWDPIGVGESPAARDEYYGYLPHVFRLVLDRAADEEVADYLVKVESERMGLRAQPERARNVARILAEYREAIDARERPGT